MTGDKTLSCTDCGDGFIWTAEEQRRYEQKGYVEPKRCGKCRTARKIWKEAGKK
jgi:predicted RNA-binding Zn-ribbon protein involved in translation (DUF1610 family)